MAAIIKLESISHSRYERWRWFIQMGKEKIKSNKLFPSREGAESAAQEFILMVKTAILAKHRDSKGKTTKMLLEWR